jgi:SAM-dependent methyltransferase
MDERKAHEIQHGGEIAEHALEVWGWQTPAGQVRARRRADLIVEQAQIGQGSRVLELGCGTGLFSRSFARTGANVVAVDLSWALIQQAKTQSPANLSLVLADAEYLPFANKAFEAVIGSSVLHHLNPQRALVEAYRILSAGGRIAFAEPNMLNPQIAVQKNIPKIKRMLGDSPDESAFISWRVKRVLKENGFVNVNVRPYDFLHPLVPNKLVSFIDRLGRFLERIPVIRAIAGSLIISGCKPALAGIGADAEGKV